MWQFSHAFERYLLSPNYILGTGEKRYKKVPLFTELTF